MVCDALLCRRWKILFNFLQAIIEISSRFKITLITHLCGLELNIDPKITTFGTWKFQWFVSGIHRHNLIKCITTVSTFISILWHYSVSLISSNNSVTRSETSRSGMTYSDILFPYVLLYLSSSHVSLNNLAFKYFLYCP